MTISPGSRDHPDDGVNEALAPLGGQVTLVTGAAKGIGRAIAQAFARAGALVVATDIDAEGLAETAALIARDGGHARAERLDVTDGSAVERIVSACRDDHGRLDVTVNNAGVIDVVPLLEFDLATWQRAFAVNVHGPFAATTASARVMVGQPPHPVTGCRGKIINVSSGAGDIPRPHLAAYGASKSALNHFSQSAAVALAGHAIAVTIMCPTSVADGMWRDMGRRLARTTGRTEEEVVRERLAATPSGRFETAAEAAAVAVFIASATGMALNGRRVWTAGFVDERDARAPNE